MDFEEIDGIKLTSTTVTKYRVDLDGDELAVLYALVQAVKDDVDENGSTVDRLKNLFEETHGQWYPGYYVFVEGTVESDGTGGLDMHND